MPIDRKRLIRNYVSAMHEGDAALFIGAGLSRPAGFVDWKGLLRDYAEELGLDIERETDLVAVAQYYLNRRNRDRSGLNQVLRKEFDKKGTASVNHEIIARLPIATVWTTNFDTLIEDYYENGGKVVDVKSTDKQVGTTKPKRDVTVYKMHGDIARPDEVIITKEDYERYARRHEVFQNALEGDLVLKNFLFLGFSFNDPHLEYMLGHLRSLLEDSKREHYTIMRKASRADFPKGAKGKREYEYELNRQALKIDDLERYSIRTLLVDEFDEIPSILEEIENHFYYRNIFVSGSAHTFGKGFDEERLNKFSHRLGKELIKQEYNLVSGFGTRIGSAVVLGALEQLYENKQHSLERRLILRPFPQKRKGDDFKEFYRKYREAMISICGITIFIAGNNADFPDAAPGALEEYEIARSLHRLIIPIGSTGFAAKQIWEEVKASHEDFYGDKVPVQLMDQLNNPNLSDEEILGAIFQIIDKFLT